MNEIIEKISAGKAILDEKFETILPHYIVLKEPFEMAVHEYRSSIPNSQIKAFDTVIHSQSDLFETQLKQAYVDVLRLEQN